jgi:peptide/nickel transport system permease protein
MRVASAGRSERPAGAIVAPRQRSRTDGRLLAGTVMLGLLALGAVIGPWLTPGDPIGMGDVMQTRLLPPLHRSVDGAIHLLGTDAFGRDVLGRLLLAARLSIGVGVAGSLLAAALGVLVGAVGAWAGGWVDRLLLALGDTLLAVPRLVLLLVIAALWGPGLPTVVSVLALTGWMGVARLVRAEVLGVRALPYVEAARALGVSPVRLLTIHVLPNALGAATVAVTLGVGSAIALESGLSFLGLGIQPPSPSWGNMIAGGRDWLLTAPWIALAPGIALVLTVVASTLIGDALGARRGESLRPPR